MDLDSGEPKAPGINVHNHNPKQTENAQVMKIFQIIHQFLSFILFTSC